MDYFTTKNNKLLYFPDGLTSIGNDSTVVVSNSDETGYVWEEKNKILFYTEKYSKEFENTTDLVVYLNKENFEYDGIGDLLY